MGEKHFSLLITVGVVMAILGATLLIVPQIQDRKAKGADTDFRSYLSVCQQAGFRPEQCLFARHHPLEAAALFGSK